MRQRGLQQEEGALHVDGVQPREALRRDVRQGLVLRRPGVVDDDVYLEFAALRVREVVLRHGDEVRGAVRVAHVGLHGERSDAVGGFERGGEGGGAFGGGVGVVA